MTGTYFSVMKQMSLIFPDSKIHFLICSNDDIKLENFEGFHVIRGLGHELEDMYSLAYCDYIIGPPSTYTGWASFYGKTPLYSIESIENTISLKKFRLVTS